jgi:hypothetical protein
MVLILRVVWVLLRMAWPLLLRVLVWLGFSSITYVGMSSVLTNLVSYMGGYMGGIPAVAVQIMALMKIDIALSLVLSGYAFKLAKDGISGAGSVKKLVMRAK